MIRLIALFVSLLLLLLTGYAWIRLDVPIGLVRIEGSLDHAERDQVGLVVQENLEGGMLGADLGALQGAIVALSWPRLVSIRRVWPASLEISVEKAMVVARWNDSYLTSDGRVVQLPSPQGGVPVLVCSISKPKEALETYLRLNMIAADVGLELEQLQENELGEWKLSFPGGVTLMLGSEQLSERLERFVAVYRRDLNTRFDRVAHMDARYASGLAVSWQPAVLAAANNLSANGI